MKTGTRSSHEEWPQLYARASPEWQKILLQLLQSPAIQTLQLDRLFLFEYDKDLEQALLLILRAATGVSPREIRVPVSKTNTVQLRRTMASRNGPDGCGQ